MVADRHPVGGAGCQYLGRLRRRANFTVRHQLAGQDIGSLGAGNAGTVGKRTRRHHSPGAGAFRPCGTARGGRRPIADNQTAQTCVG